VYITRLSDRLTDHKLINWVGIYFFSDSNNYIDNFSARDEAVYPQQQGETFAYKVEPIATILRQNCLANWSPGRIIMPF